MRRVQVEFDADVFATLGRSPEEVAREMRHRGLVSEARPVFRML